MPHLYDYPLAIVDVETTGTSYTHGGVIDLGILRIEHGQLVQTYQQLVNPGAAIPAFITNLTGITNDQLADAPSFADIAWEVEDLLADCVFVAHNARFDYAFIKEEFRRVGTRYAPKTFCTVKLSRALYPQHRHHNLDSVISRFQIAVTDRHRAFGDAQATWHAMQAMVQQADPALLEHIVKQQLRQPTLPPQLPKTTIDSLPDSPGVYIFENTSGATLYVGKSINIKSRVLSHFSDDVRSAKELTLSQEVAHIRTVPTTGELGALLKESQLIKSLVPIYNRVLRRKTELVLAIQGQNDQGFSIVRTARYGQAQIESRISSIEPRDRGKLETRGSKLGPVAMESVVAIFRSQREAKESLTKMAKEFKLCQKLLGLQSGSGACFNYHLGVCLGACLGKENPLAYNLRFSQAFEQMRLQRWPFAGPIMVTETQAATSQTSRYIIDQWCVVACLEQHDQAVEMVQLDNVFDLDQYKILRRWLSSPGSKASIKTLQPDELMALQQIAKSSI
jgi:DNA polymerase-3 subunit epsilon